ncbi:MAG TPA: hypothetical protein VNZ03_21090 [Terriglobales bacterium]|jgi:hypothetical protein|nr:hypothetical protein [Terriglobales bacterium]
MPGEKKREERWLELCQQAVIEKDPTKLMALVAEINRLLEAREQHPKRKIAETGG